MNKNTNHKLIVWLGVTLGVISSLILFFILWRRPTNDHEIIDHSIPKIKLPDEIVVEQEASPLIKTQPKLTKTAQHSQHRDDLKKIEGIGPKISQLLSEHDINTFATLANTKVEELKNLLTDAKIRIADPTTWPEQAIYAVKKDWEGLKGFQQELKGGRREE